MAVGTVSEQQLGYISVDQYMTCTWWSCGNILHFHFGYHKHVFLKVLSLTKEGKQFNVDLWFKEGSQTVLD